VTGVARLDLVAFTERLAAVEERIAAAARAAGRSPADVGLIGVTKTHPPATAQLAIDAGLLDLGENRVQELLAKRSRVTGGRWHLIGHLQRNKAKDVIGQHVLVHTLDRRELADVLSRRAAEAGVVQRVLVQVNVGEDPAKSGCRLSETAELVAYARSLPNLAVEGLMTMPPLPPEGVDHATAAQPHFAALREERDRLRERFPEVVHLSMGMSADLEAAVAEGATMVRVGTALFGTRGEAPWRPEDER
jgi:PLP dependent protein